MEHLFPMLAASPTAALVGAVVYLILTTRRLEHRVESLSKFLGAPRPERKYGKRVFLPILAALVLLLVSGCSFSRTCTAPGVCETHFDISTNAAPAIPIIIR